MSSHNIWADTSLAPFYGTVTSAAVFVVQAAYLGAKKNDTKRADRVATRRLSVSFWLILRIIGCVAWLILTIFSSSLKKGSYVWYEDQDFRALAACITSVYATALAAVSLSRHRIATWHLNTVLLVSLMTYSYRDLYPLGTFTRVPKDLHEGWLLWAKIALLTIVGLVIPLLTPPEYIPVDDDDPALDLNPGQKAPLLLRLLFAYLDPLVYLAYRDPESVPEKLPPLAYALSSKVQVKDAFPFLDPFSGDRVYSLFRGLLKYHRKTAIQLTLLTIVKTLLTFVAPVGINRLLHYLETKGEGAIVRPWVWISWLFLGPFLRSMMMEWFMHKSTSTMACTQGILTQLVFKHALRIRLDLESQKTVKSNIIGRINTLATADVGSITEPSLPMNLYEVVWAPFNLLLTIGFLYSILDWSALVGLAIMLICIPVPGYLSQMMRDVQKKSMKKMDARIQKVTEAMSMLRMIKLFGWEPRMRDQIDERRVDELTYVRWNKILVLLTAHANFLIPLLTMIGTYATFTLIMHRQLTAAIVFSSITVFEILRQKFRLVVNGIPAIVQAKVSLDRVNDFLRRTELLDAFSAVDNVAVNAAHDKLGFRNAEFVWSSESRRDFKLRIEDELFFDTGINLIVGLTGAGKTSLLLALLGEMHFVPSGPDSWFHLPREDGVAYAAQESWVQSDSIRDNILFGSLYEEDRYNKVLDQCALLSDLALFEAGDRTEVGEKGLTLSGGQKARITLARAVYSRAKVLLLDDVLAALDVHTAKSIVNRCLNGDLVTGRTVLLATHNLALTRPLARSVTLIKLDGSILHGSVADVLGPDHTMDTEILEEEEALERSKQDEDDTLLNNTQPAGKLTTREEIEVGHVQWAAFKLFLGNLSGHIVAFWLAVIGSIALNTAIIAFQSWFLGYWSTQYQLRDPSDVPSSSYLTVYALLSLLCIICYTAGYTIFTFGSLRAGRIIHQTLIESVLGTTLRWLDTTPTARVIARTTVDIKAVDNGIPFVIYRFTELNLQLIIQFGSIILFSPAFIFPGVMLTCLGGVFGQLYMKAQLPVKRCNANAKSPLLGHFGAAISGLVSIRAYGAQESYFEESMCRIDAYTRSTTTFYDLHRWISIRTDALAGIFTSSLAIYLVYGRGSNMSAANTGFSLAMAVSFSSLILIWVRIFNAVELHGNSLERILRYVKTEQEPKASVMGIPPAYWPSSGNLRVENLCAMYTLDGPKVLHNLSFEIKSGERVGVVGRTGSGKSSLTLSLLRCIPTAGEVYYDDLPTSTMNLDALRSSITIIPQMPELLSGTLRYNLDPFSQHDDSTINDALRSAGLFSLQEENEENKINLDTNISSGGGNLSVGQRQMLALARAIVRRSKLLILDEATSAIDYKTDAVIQKTLREELKDVALITVAHRLQTIMDFDKIMVLDEGRIVEFDTPRILLNSEKGWFRRLVDKSSDRSALYAAARA
ncbi:P-loop containing nucleoside triphosphate hydrolase protein [Armillaria gallica]|uniref:P-loop containing nucleoside triphosphate hydrolase protein n=1 Tax=Armillaria gallica TaxID=47427 RepID=A0A2H3DRM7_ARMGA|nr:P-loop containing nucleoside triphosphate hydrolase protein [Armillaria gallica]